LYLPLSAPEIRPEDRTSVREQFLKFTERFCLSAWQKSIDNFYTKNHNNKVNNIFSGGMISWQTKLISESA
jgi:hypothetical protein